jgi:hypothetical protein
VAIDENNLSELVLAPEQFSGPANPAKRADPSTFQPVRRSSALVVGLMTGLAALSAGGCEDESVSDTEHGRPYSNVVGLFEPGPHLDAGSTVMFHCQHDTVPGVETDAGADQKSDKTQLKPISGTLTISFTTTPPPGGDVAMWVRPGFTPDYGVVWIEAPNRDYVKTLALWGKDYVATNLTTYLYSTRSGCKGDADVVASATPPSHMSRSLTWNGKNTDRKTVAQGRYVLWLELETQENPHFEATQVLFDALDTPWTKQIPAAPIHQDLTLTYTPTR